MGIDGTRKLAEEGYGRVWPEVIRMDDQVRARIDAIWNRLGIP
jgi:4-hydroxy-3-polyprenylbenzoate decarboxylase